MNIFDIERDYFLLNLNETAGMVDGYSAIGDELYEIISSTKPTMVDTSMYMRSISNYVLRTDCFIKSISIKYYSYNESAIKPDKRGQFIPTDNTEHLSRDKKLINCGFEFYELTKDPLKVNKEYFMEAFSHEVSHAYRYYQIISKNNGIEPASVKKANEVYGLSNGIYINDESYKKMLPMLQRMNYLADKDEISAFVNQTYEEVKQNENITPSNVSRYFSSFRMYRETELLKGLLVLFDKMISTPIGKEICLNYLSAVYNDNYKGEKSIRLFRQKIASTILYRSKKFINILKKAFTDFNRNDRHQKLDVDEMRIEQFVKGLDVIL